MSHLKFIFIAISSLVFWVGFAQETNNYYDQIEKIDYDLTNNDPYKAIKKMDKLAEVYFNEEDIYFARGLVKYYMMDIYGAREDFNKYIELGFKIETGWLKAIISDQFLVDLFTEHYYDTGKLFPENGYKKQYNIRDSLQGALRPERTCFDIYYYDLTVKIMPKTKSISGNNDIYFNTLANTNKIQIDLSDNFIINSIKCEGKELNYERYYDAIFINFDKPLQTNHSYKISISYSGKPRNAIRPPWNGGFVWGKKRSKHWVGVACEHLGASSWWPCKDHLSEKPDSMTINVQIPSKYIAISNGNLISTYPIENGYTNYEWHVSYPINSYCVTFYMGDFVNFSEEYVNSNGSYNIDYYVLPHNLKVAKEYYKQTKEIVEVYEKLYGEYPYAIDGIAMVESPYEGMEHQSAIAIGGDYGKSKRRNYENKDYDYLVVHELAHEWWGNTVTMSDMADAWISEAFATYSEHLFMEEKFGYEEYLNATADNMSMIFNIWPIVGNSNVNDNTFVGGDIYHKGAAMLNNLRCIIDNDTLFFNLIKKFYNANKFQTINSDDFISFVNEETNMELTDFFNKFLYDKEPPILEYEFSNKYGSFEFTYSWINVGRNFSMPFSLMINGNECLRVVGTSEKQTLKLMDISTFVLPNEFMYDESCLVKNSFTYFWTNWKQ